MYGDNLLWYVLVFGFVVTAVAETFLPFRSLPSSTARRWFSNSALLAISSAAVAYVFQFSAVAFAVRTASHGLLYRKPLPSAVRFAVGFVLLDLAFYSSHRVFHAFGILWRFHQVHHSETDLDLTTEFRFHPGEALLTQGTLLLTIAAVGVPPAAVAVNGFVSLVQGFFQHANLRFPERIDRVLRLLIITPGAHRVHHSQDIAHQNSNFGTIFSIWDRIFRTYREEKLDNGRFGLAELASGSELNPVRLLVLPFRSAKPQRVTTERLPVPTYNGE